MACSNNKARSVHSKLCEVNYPYVRYAASTNVPATKQKNCTLDSSSVPDTQTLGYEANMDLISIDEFISFMPANAKFGTYCDLKKKTKGVHFCVDRGRRTVDGRRLSWLWIFPKGIVGAAHKVITDDPSFIWTKQDIVDAYRAANNPTLPMFTRHVDTYSELAITFCLPLPK